MSDASPEERLRTSVESIAPLDRSMESEVWERLDDLTKPPRSLGRLEEVAAHVACAQGTLRPSVEQKTLIVAAGDHGVVAEGISPYPQDVTWQMVANIASGGAAINQIAKSVGAAIVIVDVGVARDVSDLQGVRAEKIASGTGNMCEGSAMTRTEAARAVLVGIDLAREAIANGTQLLGVGEMGIGNTTAASALTAAFTGADPRLVVGPGTGLDDAGVSRKATVVAQALQVNADSMDEPLGTLSAVGGLEIACLAGVALGAALGRTCVVIDGFVAGAAALAAVRICPAAGDFMISSHRSAEPGHELVLDAMDQAPLLDLDMRLGEGTGATVAMGIVDAACHVLAGMATFSEAGVAEKSEAPG